MRFESREPTNMGDTKIMNMGRFYFLIVLFLISFPESGLSQLSAQEEYERGNTFYRELKYQEAKDAYERATVLEPNAWQVWQLLGMSHIKLGDKKGAIKAIEKALSINLDNPKLSSLLTSLISDSLDNGTFRKAKREAKKRRRKNRVKKFFVSLSTGPSYLFLRHTFDYDVASRKVLKVFEGNTSSFGYVADVRLGWKNSKNWEIAFSRKKTFFTMPYIVPLEEKVFPRGEWIDNVLLRHTLFGMTLKKYLGTGSKGAYVGFGVGTSYIRSRGTKRRFGGGGIGFSAEGGYRISRRFEFGGELIWSNITYDDLQVQSDGIKYKRQFVAIRSYITLRVL